MYYELTKREKKIAKAAIDKGVNAAFTAGLEKAEAIMQEWHIHKKNSEEATEQLNIWVAFFRRS